MNFPKTKERESPPFVGQTQTPYITVLTVPRPGYIVRIPHPTLRGRFFTKTFRQLGVDLPELLDKAKAWRDLTYQIHYGKPVPVRAFHKQQANSSTGIPGVRKLIKIVKSKQRDGAVKERALSYVMAEIHLVPGKDGTRSKGSRSKLFSLIKYSETEAIQLAIEWRRAQEDRLRAQDNAAT